MNKRALMLTAATAALLSGHALAQTQITGKDTTPQYTNQDGTITITTSGSIVITTNPTTAPALTINGGTTPGSAADVINQGAIDYMGVGSSTNPLTGIAMVTGNTGGLDNVGKIDFSGAGSNKTGILFTGTGEFKGDLTQTSGGQTLQSLFAGITSWTFDAPNAAAILLESGSTFKVQGDNSIGINIASGTTLGSVNGGNPLPSDIDIIGSLAMTPTSSSSGSSASDGIEIGGTMYGNINFLPGGSITVQGNGGSNGIYILPCVSPPSCSTTPAGVLYGDINIDGNLGVTPVSTTSTTSTGDAAILMAGTLNGNINVGTSGVVSGTGAGAQGIVITGQINANASDGATGAIVNDGTIETLGTTNPSSAGNNPQAGTALFVQGSIAGGIFNNGPIGGNTTQNAIISSVGGSPTINISSSSATGATAVNIGGYTDNGDTASLLNRGSITATSENADTSTEAILINGVTMTNNVNLASGILNSGSISASSTTDTHGNSSINAIAVLLEGYDSVPTLTNTNEDTSRPGSISASVSGEEGGEAIAIDIVGTNASLPTIVNSGTIAASATTTNSQLTNGALRAIAIEDTSGTLTSITNNSSAIIEALATTLSDNTQVTTAIDTEANHTSFTLTNMGTILGNIFLGSGSNNITCNGVAANNLATITAQTIDFGGGSGNGLDIKSNCTVTSQVYSGSPVNLTSGTVNITVEASGTLNLLTAASATSGNTPPNLVQGTTLNAGTFNVESSSFLDIHYSQGFNTTLFPNAVIVDAQNGATISDNATVTFTPDSFIAPPVGVKSATFVVLEAQTLNVTLHELSIIQTKFLSTLSYLYGPLESGVTLTNGNTGPELLLTITPKTIGADGCKTQSELNGCNLDHIPLSGYAAELFPYANVALGNDNTLGSAVINGVTNSTNAQQVYENFAPDVSGAIRADAISLTDDATNIVAARQRALRQYANQEGDLTLWGQQFIQRLNQDSTTAGAGYTDTGFGFAVGGDEGDPVDGRYGVAFTFFSGDTSEKQPRLTKTRSDWYMLSGYTDWRGKGLFLDTQLNVGYASLSGDRYQQLEVPTNTGTFNLFQRTAYNQRPAEYGSIGATTGAIFDEDGTVFTPQISLDGLAMRQESYNESGGGNGFDLHVASSYAQSVRGFAGLGIRQDFDFTDFLLQPDVLAGYRYDFANGAESLKANFESVNPPSVFEVTGPKPDKGNIVASGGVAVTTGAWSLGFNFDYLKAGSGNTSESGSITLLGRI